MYLPSNHSSDLLVIDFETTGIDPQTDVIVGVGIADRHFPQGIYFDICNNSELHTSELMQRIEHRPKIAHNISFEMIMETMFHEHMKNVPSQNNYRYCTQGLLNQLEGDFAGGYTRGESNLKLKVLQTELLGWEERGDVELDAWLIENGYHTNGKANKAEMWRAPPEILGVYCGLDAQSTWMLYDRIYRPVLEDYPELDLYHSRDYMNLGRLIKEQRLTGMQIDKDGLIYYISNLEWMIDTLRYNFIHYSPAAPYIAEYNQAVVEAKIAKEPERTTKSGKESKNWLKWKAAVEDLKGECHFNLNSSDQKGWLFYDRLFKTEIEHTTNWKGEKVINLNIDVGDETVTLPCTATGKRPIDKEILPRLGEAGKVLFEYNKLNKELGYCKSLLDQVGNGDIYYPQLRLSGTKTDRCAGTGGHNIQQQPKTYDYMKCYTHREGKVLIQLDINALEAVVLAELSECKSYMKLYGPDAVEGNDVYLFVGSGLGSFAQPVLDAGYDPENPDPEIVKKVKKECKGLRAIFKKFHLSGQYGAGYYRIWKDLQIQEIYLEKEECRTMHTNYWTLFEDVIKYVDKLNDERIANNGYFLDGLGCPVTVSEDFLKDILNRCIQNTGHKILVRYLYHLNNLRKSSKLDFYPIMVDFHDETIWECNKEDAQTVLELFNEAWRLTNKELGGIIPLTGEPEICTSWADFKSEDPRGVL